MQVFLCQNSRFSRRGWIIIIKTRIGRHAWAMASALIALHATLVWFVRAPTILSDEAVYVVLARALRGFQYRELFQVDLPVHRMYPPGYPLLLAAWSAIGTERLDWLVLVGIASSAGALFLLFSAVRNGWGSGVALACLSGVALNFTLISSTGWLVSEAPFMFFSTLALWALSHKGDRPRDALTAGAATIAAALIRSAGASFVVGLALYWLWQRRYRRVLTYGLLAGLTVGGWLVFAALAPMQVPGNSYIADAAVHPAGTSLFRAVVDRALGKLLYARYLYWQLAPTVQGSVLDDVIAVPVLLGGLGVGLFALAIEWPATIVYIVSYGALLMVWPWTIGRFLLPLLPWLVSALIIGIDRLVAIVRPRWRTAGICLAAGVLALKGLSDTSHTIERRQPCDRAAALPSRACLGCHLKRWSVYSAIISDGRDRGIPWTQLILRYKALHDDLNLRIENRLSIPVAYLMLVLLALAPHAPRFLAGLPPTAAALTVLNRRYYGFLYEKRGGLFAVGAWGLHLLHHLCNGFSLATGTLLFLAARYLGLRLPGALSAEPWSAARLISASATVTMRKRTTYAAG